MMLEFGLEVKQSLEPEPKVEVRIELESELRGSLLEVGSLRLSLRLTWRASLRLRLELTKKVRGGIERVW